MSGSFSQNLLKQVLSVSELTDRIKTLIEDVFCDVYVVGEISNAKVHHSGHWYFSLKDKEATLPCVCFRNTNQAFKFRLEDGLMMVARGRLSVYPPKGAYQMIVSSLEPVGIGDWQLAFEQLRTQLEGEGLLEAARKRPIPIMPLKIGVVTSPAGAAIKDILSALARRNRSVSIVIAPAKVQGEGSAEEIAQALSNLQQDPKVEVILVARGGGSIEDLWSFNTEIVARAVANCRVPVISGVGHETDTTICDLVADMRAPTPTAAAELVCKGTVEILEKWSFLKARLDSSMREKLVSCRRLLERRNPLVYLNAYQSRLNQHRAELRHEQKQLIASMNRLITALRHRWHENAQKLGSLRPAKVMSRGFSLLRNSKGHVISSFLQVKEGETIEALLSEGKLSLTVQSVDHKW